MGFPRALFAALCARPDVFLSLFITIPLAGALIYRITDLFVPRLLSFFFTGTGPTFRYYLFHFITFLPSFGQQN